VIASVYSVGSLANGLAHCGYPAEKLSHKTVLVKINAAHPPAPDHPRTDPELLKGVLALLVDSGARPTICESSRGKFERNLKAMGILRSVRTKSVRVLEVDDLPTERVTVNGEDHHVPEEYLDYEIRIAVPCASKRENMLFSNNVKLMFGAVPIRPYSRPGETVWRSKLHDDLHRSVANLYMAIEAFAPFHLYVNGGNAYDERRGPFRMTDILVGDDALALDQLVLERWFPSHTLPEYLKRLVESLEGQKG
jgi:uncharacterized protein (DUF362 family)